MILLDKLTKQKKRILKLLKFWGYGLFMVAATACEEFVEVDPPDTALVGETVFDDDINASAAMLGIYGRMVESAGTMFTSGGNLTILSGLSSDELLSYSITLIDFEQNELLEGNGNVSGIWNDFYEFIYSCNSVLEGIENSVSITDSLVLQFEGEAKFVRAWMYFYLVNLWDDVPLVLATNYETNILLPRVPRVQVYEQIENDLQDALNLLGEDYPSDQRIRPNKAVVSALWARVHLYREDWSNAEILATTLIEDDRYSLEETPGNVFLDTSQEAIWQLQSINPDVGSYDALRFVLTRSPISRSFGVSLRPEFVDAFEEDDLRETSWIGVLNSGEDTFYYPFKFKTRFLGDGESSNEYLTVFRLAEMYLIRAEARARQGNITGAQEDLNRVRARAGLQETTAADLPSLLLAIEKERKVELFAELGHRWLDLKRTGRATDVLSPIKPGWQDTDVLWPVPRNEFLNNPNLGEQNAGY